MTAGLMSSQEALQQLINALSLGSTYALLALGLAMVFSILGLVNFAHGELVTVAAYTAVLPGLASKSAMEARRMPTTM